MKTSGNFNYYLDNESKTIEEIMHLVTSDMTVSIRGLDVLYFSPKKENKQKSFNLGNNTETVTSEILKQENNKQNKGVIKGSFEGWYNTPLGEKSLKDITPSRKYIEKLGSINYNRPFSICNNKEEDMNRLVEEELERQEQQIFKDCERTNLGVLQGELKADWLDFMGNTMKRGKTIKYEPSATIGVEEITKPYPFFENEDLAQETAEQIKQAVKEKNDKPQLSWEFIEEMAKRMVNNKSNGIITKEVLEELKNTNFAFKLYEVLAGKQINNTVIEVEEHQSKNGGILEGVEFPFDFTSFTKKNMESHQEMQERVIKDWDKIVLNDSKKQTEGQKHDEGKLPIDIMLTVQFPKAIQAICKATLFGRNKYKETDKDWLNFKRVKGGSTTYANAGQRHNFNKSGKDEQSGLPHIIHKCWNAMAELELWIEENKYEL